MTGVVVRALGEKGFGFIKGEDGKEYFFHRTDLNGFFEDLVNDVEGGRRIKVEFNSVPSNKGLRAGDVYRVDAGV